MLQCATVVLNSGGANSAPELNEAQAWLVGSWVFPRPPLFLDEPFAVVQ